MLESAVGFNTPQNCWRNTCRYIQNYLTEFIQIFIIRRMANNIKSRGVSGTFNFCEKSYRLTHFVLGCETPQNRPRVKQRNGSLRLNFRMNFVTNLKSRIFQVVQANRPAANEGQGT